MRQPLVSIMMPAYNAAAFIGLAIASAREQRFEDWELIVVDDGSTDDTGEIAARGQSDARIHFSRQENAGEAVARNRALEAMHGKYVAFLDADDLFLPDHLSLTTDYLETHSDRAGVYTDGNYCDETGMRLEPLSSRRRGPFEGDLFESLVYASDVFGPPLCVVVRRDLVMRHGLRWDPAIVIGPDWDFFVRYVQHGPFGYLPERTCLYRVHTSNITVRTGAARRKASLAVCREKAIHLPGFNQFTVETRAWVLYDLLVNLLNDDPDGQMAVVRWPEFQALPATEQAHILRRMAGEQIALGKHDAQASAWLAAARRLDPHDTRTALLATLHRLSPRASRRLLRARGAGGRGDDGRHPLADLAATTKSGAGEKP
jgi:glycosyltransferase involved in cell wall biosynthesis